MRRKKKISVLRARLSKHRDKKNLDSVSQNACATEIPKNSAKLNVNDELGIVNETSR